MNPLLGWWEQLTGAICPGCGQPLGQPLLCSSCRAALVPRHLPQFVYLGDYRRLGRLPKAIKYQGQRKLAAYLGQLLAQGVKQAGWGLNGVTAVPTLPFRQIRRGYNQAELLALAAAQALQVPMRGCSCALPGTGRKLKKPCYSAYNFPRPPSGPAQK